jgi:carboxyl-terminal processing protease
MKRPHIRVVGLIGGVVLAMAVLLGGVWLGGHPGSLPPLLRGSFFESRRDTVTEQALNILTTRYYRPLTRSSLVDVGLSGMVASLDDPYSRYLDPQTYRERSEQSTRELAGIGITAEAEPEGLRVVRVFEHSPAARAGLRAGDVIIKVGSISLADRSEGSAFDLIRGPAGTSVELTFTRDDTAHTVSVERANIVVPAATWQMLDYRHVRIGHLTLTGFTEGSGDELRAQVRAALAAHAQALILDLRGNGGGLISEAINVASAFIARGEIMSAEERGQPRRVYTARGDAIAAHIPLVVLVDHGTASSAEIVTAALQDHGRAKVVGTQTYGKGVFQITERLINGGALDFTIGQYFTPNGENLGGGGARQGAGIIPNVYASEEAGTDHDGILAAGERTVAAQVHQP